VASIKAIVRERIAKANAVQGMGVQQQAWAKDAWAKADANGDKRHPYVVAQEQTGSKPRGLFG